MTEQLKPCPFCGGINVIHSGYRMYCHACGAEGPDADSADESAAIAAWNRRAQPTQAGAEPVYWEYKHVDDDPDDWQRLVPRTMQTLEVALAEIQGYRMGKKKLYEVRALYTHPPAQVPLTDEELRMISKQQDPVVVLHHNVLAFAHAIIAAYEAKNGIGGGK